MVLHGRFLFQRYFHTLEHHFEKFEFEVFTDFFCRLGKECSRFYYLHSKDYVTNAPSETIIQFRNSIDWFCPTALLSRLVEGIRVNLYPYQVILHNTLALESLQTQLCKILRSMDQHLCSRRTDPRASHNCLSPFHPKVWGKAFPFTTVATEVGYSPTSTHIPLMYVQTLL